MQILALFLFAVFIAFLAYNLKKKKIVEPVAFTNGYRAVLADNVVYYNQLPDADKVKFENRMQQFLSQVKITGVGTAVTLEDRVFVAASAIIPIFAFSNWQYNNLHEVLLYPESFNQEFNTGNEQAKPVLGMVGNGALQQVMILSQPSLREGFTNKTHKENTGIHEFVHLIDKTDGDVDGMPENLLDKQYLMPWLDLMNKSIKEILAGESDINPYGATNKAEFLAVVAEYFFERPDLLQAKHPELYLLLEQVFKQDPAKAMAK